MKKFSEFGGPLAAFIKNSPPPVNSTIYVAFDCSGALVWFETLEEGRVRRPHLQFEQIDRPGFKQRLCDWQAKRLAFEQLQIAEWKKELEHHFREFSPEAFTMAYECLSRMSDGSLTYDEIAEEMPRVIETVSFAVAVGRSQERLIHSSVSEGRCA